MGASSLTMNRAPGAMVSGPMMSSTRWGSRSSVMRVAAVGAMELTLMFFFSPSMARTFIRPTSPDLAAA